MPTVTKRQHWFLFATAIALVAVPVFFQAPLVRFLPWVSLGLTLVFVAIGHRLYQRPSGRIWGDLLIGFSWTWLSGSLYWGWLRWEPFWHLPVEAIGFPFAIWGLQQSRHRIGNCFYLGSLFGTVLTDVYFYLTDLLPYWRSIMRVEPDLVGSIFRNALLQVETPWGIGCAAVFACVLLGVSLLPLRSPHLHWWAFGGAVLSTILVDSLFWFAAATA